MSAKHDDDWAQIIVETALGIKVSKPFVGIVLIDEDRVSKGAFVFNNWSGRDIHVSCVLRRPMTVAEMRYLARYVFRKMDCHRCTALTATRNASARTALRRLGFSIEGFIREYFPDDDAVVYGLLKSEQKIVRV